jgi:hypothetical protein
MTGFNVAFRMARDLLVVAKITKFPPLPIGLHVALSRRSLNLQNYLREKPGIFKGEQE